MTNLIPFNYNSKQVRTIMKDGEPWFVAADICEVLDIQNATQALCRLDEDERSMFNIGRQGEANIVNEYGLYNLILSSRKPEAKEFKRWITHEVIPQIRKTGTYSIKPVTALEALQQTVQALTEQAQRMDKLEATQQAIKEAVIAEPDNWREDINRKMNKIAEAIGLNKYREVRSESYRLLEQRAGVLLERRLDNKKARLLKEGASQTTIKNTRKIDIIDEDKKLREIYSKIVSEYFIKYVA